jgi:hypothetical protein
MPEDDIDLTHIGKQWRPNRKARRATSKAAYKGHRNKLRAAWLAQQRATVLSLTDGSEETPSDDSEDALASDPT